MIQKVKWFAIAMALVWNANFLAAQDCGCQANAGVAVAQGYGDCDTCARRGHGFFHHHHRANCGRQITYAQAASLWSGYCTDDCSFDGGGHGGCCIGRNAGNLGQFGWPDGCACGNADCDGGCGHGHGGLNLGNFFAGMHARHAAFRCRLGGCFGGHSVVGDDCGCEEDPCGCGGGLLGGHRHGCGHHGCGLFSRLHGRGCGCSGSYFDECCDGMELSGTESVVENAMESTDANQQTVEAIEIPLP